MNTASDVTTYLEKCAPALAGRIANRSKLLTAEREQRGAAVRPSARTQETRAPSRLQPLRGRSARRRRPNPPPTSGWSRSARRVRA